MSEHEEHSSFIKTPQQLIVVVLLSFLVPIIGIVLLVNLVLSKPSADPSALAPEAVAKRLQPVGRVEFGAAGAAASGPRSGEDIVKSACAACHQAYRDVRVRGRAALDPTDPANKANRCLPRSNTAR